MTPIRAKISSSRIQKNWQCCSWPRTVVLKAFSLMKTEQSLSKMKEEIVDKDLFSDSTVRVDFLVCFILHKIPFDVVYSIMQASVVEGCRLPVRMRNTEDWRNICYTAVFI